MEKEKLDREKMATMAQRSDNHGGGVAQFVSAPNLGNIPQEHC